MSAKAALNAKDSIPMIAKTTVAGSNTSCVVTGDCAMGGDEWWGQREEAQRSSVCKDPSANV